MSTSVCLINMLIYRLYTDCSRARGHNVVMKYVPNTARNSMCCKIKKVCDLECSVCHMSEYFKLILMGIKLWEPTTSSLWAFCLLFFYKNIRYFFHQALTLLSCAGPEQAPPASAWLARSGLTTDCRNVWRERQSWRASITRSKVTLVSASCCVYILNTNLGVFFRKLTKNVAEISFPKKDST